MLKSDSEALRRVEVEVEFDLQCMCWGFVTLLTMWNRDGNKPTWIEGRAKDLLVQRLVIEKCLDN